MKLDVFNEGERYELSAAVLIYTNRHKGHAFATKHSVETHDGKPVIRPGTPFAEADYAAMIKAMAPKERPGMNWNDPRVLARGLGRLIWWSAPRQRSLFFKKSGQVSATFDARGRAPCPGLVFVACERELYMYAFKGTHAPEQQTRLHQAPFFNVWSRGKVCSGNAQAPGEHERENLEAWERMFFGSHFTHPNFTQKDRLTLGVNPVDFWRETMANPPEVFPEERLVDLKLTVGDLLAVDLNDKLAAIPVATGEF